MSKELALSPHKGQSQTGPALNGERLEFSWGAAYIRGVSTDVGGVLKAAGSWESPARGHLPGPRGLLWYWPRGHNQLAPSEAHCPCQRPSISSWTSHLNSGPSVRPYYERQEFKSKKKTRNSEEYTTQRMGENTLTHAFKRHSHTSSSVHSIQPWLHCCFWEVNQVAEGGTIEIFTPYLFILNHVNILYS